MTEQKNSEFEERKEELEVTKSPQVRKTVKAKTKKVSKINYGAIITGVITFIICLVLFGLFYKFYLKNVMNDQKTKVQKDITITDTGIADAVEKIYDAVVVVETYQKETLYSSGTGFVFKTDDKNAYIITNHHVVASATDFKLQFTNGKTVEAKLVGSDEYSDTAVLTVEKKEIISVAEIGSSTEMRVGDTTFAVGAPIDSSVYSWTVTRGILSGKNRLVEVSSSSGNGNSFIMEVIQTDAAINSGNSGGPLCNSNGQVVGVTNMKLASESIEGMGFAIPIEDASYYAECIISGKGIARPYLGIALSDYSSNNAANSYWGLFFGWGSGQTKTGVYVQTIEQGSSADQAGMKVGDNIKKINDIEVKDVSHFKYELYKYQIGDKINITVERDGKELVLNVTLKSNLEMN